MKALKIVVVMAALFSAVVCQAGGLTKPVSVHESFMGRSLSMQNYLSKQLDVKGEEGDLRGSIYEFHTKSPAKAFALSLLVPGLGQYYNGSKIKAVSFLAVDALLWSGFAVYRNKGASMETDYKAFADNNYRYSQYRTWWDGLDSASQNVFSHRINFDPSGSPVRSREYYENIGKYDQFQVGWGSSGLNHPPPIYANDSTRTTWYGDNNERTTYLNMRKKSNDYFANAKTMVVVAISNHLVSAFEAAIGARRFNRGGKQYSLEVQPYNHNGRIIAMAVASAKF